MKCEGSLKNMDDRMMDMTGLIVSSQGVANIDFGLYFSCLVSQGYQALLSIGPLQSAQNSFPTPCLLLLKGEMTLQFMEFYVEGRGIN